MFVDEVLRGSFLLANIYQIEVQGTERLDKKDFVDRMQKVTEETPLREQTLERTLLELNDLLGVQVRSVLKPGELPGTSDVVLKIVEQKPYRISFDGDNFGSSLTGENRFGLTGTYGSLFKLGDEISLRTVLSDGDLFFISPSYKFPITNFGTTLKASFTYSDHALGQDLAVLDAGGSSYIYKLEVTQPLSRKRKSRMYVRGGFEFRQFRNEVFGDETSSEDDLADIYFTLGGNLSDKFKGRSFYEFRAQQGFTESDPNAPLNSRASGQGDVFIGSGRLARYQGTGLGKTYLFGKLEGQWASDRVLSPDQFDYRGDGKGDGIGVTVEWIVG